MIVSVLRHLSRTSTGHLKYFLANEKVVLVLVSVVEGCNCACKHRTFKTRCRESKEQLTICGNAFKWPIYDSFGQGVVTSLHNNVTMLGWLAFGLHYSLFTQIILPTLHSRSARLELHFLHWFVFPITLKVLTLAFQLDGSRRCRRNTHPFSNWNARVQTLSTHWRICTRNEL